MKINFPFFQKEWLGIQFSSLESNLSLVKLPSKEFYDEVYENLIFKYGSINKFPKKWIQEKKSITDYLIKNYSGKKFLSYGSGLGAVEIELKRRKQVVSAYDFSTKNIFLKKNNIKMIDFSNSELKFEIIYLSYLLYCFNEQDCYKLIRKLKSRLTPGGKILIFFNEKNSISLKDLLRIPYILIFNWHKYQFWGYQRNSFFYKEIFSKEHLILERKDKFNIHTVLVFRNI